ncbi:Cell death regulator Aven [Apodemus speciosus]|uniref:Cell death regulator Aven n=1 Tax=Apodemus speciosus TaxID=105296 RepID=A0ABQ0EI71_APOSI
MLRGVHLNAATYPVLLPDGLPLTEVQKMLSANPLKGFASDCLCTETWDNQQQQI